MEQLHSFSKRKPKRNSQLPNSFGSIEDFLDKYFLFIENWEQPPQENAINESRTAIWIASTVLTYNEYIRTKSTNLLRYAFDVSTISNLAVLYSTNPSNSRYSTNINNCTKDSSRPISPFLINIDGKFEDAEKVNQRDDIFDFAGENSITLILKFANVSDYVLQKSPILNIRF